MFCSWVYGHPRIVISVIVFVHPQIMIVVKNAIIGVGLRNYCGSNRLTRVLLN